MLAHVPGFELAAIFSPEHGIAGMLDTTQIGNSADAATGAPVYSVYGDTDAKRRPSPEPKSLDWMRSSTTFRTWACAFTPTKARSAIFLRRPRSRKDHRRARSSRSDRRRAICKGPIADEDRESFVSYWKTPVRHGMTIGELARMFNSERGIGAKLTVVKMEGWMRGDWYDSTGMAWINPSPNMRSLTEATLYPGLGMIEGTNISVGRGTDTPFELLGAPWIASTAWPSISMRGKSAECALCPSSFTPSASNYAGQKCGGVSIIVTDRDALDAPELGLEMASALHRLYPDDYKLAALDGLLRNKATLDAVASGEDPRRIAEDWQDSLEIFKALRAKYLLY